MGRGGEGDRRWGGEAVISSTTKDRRKAAEHEARVKILKLRAEGLTLEIIAERLGISKSVVGRIGGGVKKGGET